MGLLFPCSQLENISQIAPIDKLNAIIGGNVFKGTFVVGKLGRCLTDSRLSYTAHTQLEREIKRILSMALSCLDMARS